uniref:FT-interacting protein 3-like n=1 Tax=Erigeron canadensis TaxID=72917 RepID=UPI001CB996BA|nr:FT-interacting protein 3-like [Erigeron canadensis]
MQRPPPEEFALKETNPKIAGSGNYGDKLTSTYDLVEQMQYLYVRVVKAKDLPPKDVTGGCDPYVEVKLGNYKGVTRHFEKKSNPVWDHVFAFSQDRIQSSVVEIYVKDKNFVKDDFIGKIFFELQDVPKRVPPDSPLAPQWYKLEDKKGDNKLKHGEIMLAVWKGTQADECFPEAWHSDAATIREGVSNIRGKVYLSPKLWYVRVNVIECQDLLPSDINKPVESCVKVKLGGQSITTKISGVKTVNPIWNEDLVFVAAEPFEEALLLTVECNKEEVGKCLLPFHNVQRRWDNKAVQSRWHNLEKHAVIDGEKKETKFASRIHLRVCLDGGYHVLDESANYSSDLTPTAKQLKKSSIGILELGIISAKGLSPMKTKEGRATTDAYCVAKYGGKWVRTRTIIDNFSPCWNEQYTWEVHDPCTVITIGAFDNGHLHPSNKDSRIGKVRIRLSTLETERVYTHSYPLIALHPNGVKKMGEVQLAVRFSCTSYINMLYKYSLPILPKMHYVHPLSIHQTDMLRHHATQIVSSRLARAEPPLKKEVVEYMLDVGAHIWSIRKSKANFFRIVNVASGFVGLVKWLDMICHWKNPLTTLLIHVLFVILILTPELILPTVFLYLFVVGIWRYRWKPRHPPHMDIKISYADAASPEELDEEFDTFPTSKGSALVRMRYDRLRSIGGKIQTVAGDLATQGERFHSLLSWRDPRASALFVTFCLIAAIVLYVTPFQVVALLIVFYYLRHPRFRTKLPSMPANFFRRLPSGADLML